MCVALELCEDYFDFSVNGLLPSLHPEIDDFRMEHSAISDQQSAKDVVIMRFFLKVES
jgi:hypothetical protein